MAKEMEEFCFAPAEKLLNPSEKYDHVIRAKKALNKIDIQPGNSYRYAETYDHIQKCKACRERLTSSEYYCGRCFFKCLECKNLFLRMNPIYYGEIYDEKKKIVVQQY